MSCSISVPCDMSASLMNTDIRLTDISTEENIVTKQPTREVETDRCTCVSCDNSLCKCKTCQCEKHICICNPTCFDECPTSGSSNDDPVMRQRKDSTCSCDSCSCLCGDCDMECCCS